MKKRTLAYLARRLTRVSRYGGGAALAIDAPRPKDSIGYRGQYRRWGCTVLGFISGGFALPVLATDGSILSGNLVQVVFGLALVLLIMAGSASLLKRYGTGQRGHGSAVRVIGGSAVGQRERVVLLEVGDTWLVVGVAPGHVSALHSMPKGSNTANSFANAEAAVAASGISDACAGRNGKGGGVGISGPFSIWLNQLMEKCSGEFRK